MYEIELMGHEFIETPIINEEVPVVSENEVLSPQLFNLVKSIVQIVNSIDSTQKQNLINAWNELVKAIDTIK
jgi:hypothetical protein